MLGWNKAKGQSIASGCLVLWGRWKSDVISCGESCANTAGRWGQHRPRMPRNLDSIPLPDSIARDSSSPPARSLALWTSLCWPQPAACLTAFSSVCRCAWRLGSLMARVNNSRGEAWVWEGWVWAGWGMSVRGVSVSGVRHECDRG